jgi:hypothetical protein
MKATAAKSAAARRVSVRVGFMALSLMARLHLFVGAAERGVNAVLLFMKLLIHRLTTAKKSPVESPHMRMPVNVSTGPSIRHGVATRDRRSQRPW